MRCGVFKATLRPTKEIDSLMGQLKDASWWPSTENGPFWSRSLSPFQKDHGELRAAREREEEVPRSRDEVKNNPSVSSNRLPLDPLEDCLLKRKLVVHSLPDSSERTRKKGAADPQIDGHTTHNTPDTPDTPHTPRTPHTPHTPHTTHNTRHTSHTRHTRHTHHTHTHTPHITTHHAPLTTHHTPHTTPHHTPHTHHAQTHHTLLPDWWLGRIGKTSSCATQKLNRTGHECSILEYIDVHMKETHSEYDMTSDQHTSDSIDSNTCKINCSTYGHCGVLVLSAVIQLVGENVPVNLL